MAMPPVIPSAVSVDGTETLLVRQGGALRRIGLAMLRAFVGPPSAVATVTATEMFLSAIPAQVRTVSLVAKGAKKDAPLVFCPVSPIPAGYAPLAVFSKADDTVDVLVSVPALTIGGKYSITGKVMALG